MREENPFENPKVAQEWIDAIETEVNQSRDLEIYPMLKEWVDKVSPEVILEIGSGQGICSSQIGNSFDKYIGLEPSQYLVNRAIELHKDEKRDFVVGSSYQIPLEDSSVVAIFSVGVWFHLKDLDKAHNEVSRVLKPDGKLMIFTSNPDLHNVWKKFFDISNEGENFIEGGVDVPSGRLSRNIFYLHTEEGILDSLKRNSLKVTNMTKLGFGREEEVHDDDGIWMAVEAEKV